MASVETGSLGGDQTLELPEFDAPPEDPMPLLSRWIDSAIERGVREPLAFTLSTVSADRVPSSRVLLLQRWGTDGLVFGGSYESRKGIELRQVPRASATFHWRETIQQLVVGGRVELLGEAESDELFAGRFREAQAAAAASQQSRPLDDERALLVQADELTASGDPIARPPHWGGWRLVPAEIEFWQGRPSRLHRRLRYTHDGETWARERLQP